MYFKANATLGIDCDLHDKRLQCADTGVCEMVRVVNAVLQLDRQGELSKSGKEEADDASVHVCVHAWPRTRKWGNGTALYAASAGLTCRTPLPDRP